MPEFITKERVGDSVYLRRITSDDTGNTLTDERIKTDPVFVFVPPPVVVLGDTAVATLTVPMKLVDFDGEERADAGAVTLRLRDRSKPDDDGVTFTRPVDAGTVTLRFEIAVVGSYVLTLDPPFLADARLLEPLQIRVIA